MDTSRLSSCTIPLRDRPLAEALPIITEAGFNRIDILGRMPHFSLDQAECDPAAVKAVAETNGVRVANLGTYAGVGFASDDVAEQEAALQEVQRAVDLAVFLGARSIRTFRPHSPIDDPARIDHITPWLQKAAAYAAERNIYMGFENHGGPLCGNPEHCRDLCAKVGSPYFGVVYDPCNLMASGADYQAALETMQNHIAHVHFKDGAVTADGFKLTMLGQGEIDFGWIMGRLAEIGYEGHIALEYELSDPSPEDGLKQWYEIFAAM